MCSFLRNFVDDSFRAKNIDMNIIVIGATSGIGRELVSQFVAAGHYCIATGRRTELLKELSCNKISCIETVGMDIADIRATIETLEKLKQDIDLAVVCAGTGELNPHLQYSIDEPTLHTNILGWTNVVDFLFNMFIAKGRGHLVLVTSIGGMRGEPMAPAYNASKAYQINYAESLAKKAYKLKLPISVTDIRPGLTDTRMAKGEGLFWVMPTSKVASQIIKAIDRKKRIKVVTRRWTVMSWIQCHLPWCMFRNI